MPLKIGIIGAGAIGGFFAARLALAGHTVSVLARGATLHALRERGLVLESAGQRHLVTVHASDQPAELGVQDVVLIAVKGPSLTQVLPAIVSMAGPQSVVLPALNGLPWWYFLAGAGPLAGHRLVAVDPRGLIERAIALPSILGCVVFPACSTVAPAHVVHASGNRVVVGEPAGGRSPRAEQLAAAFCDAGFDAEASADVRREVWLKLLGNACFNPVSLLTRCSTDRLIDDAAVRGLFVAMMTEASAVAAAVGVDVAIDPAQRLAMTRKLGRVKTSMLQDALAGRPVELDAILGALVEVASATGVPAPMLHAVYALARAHAVAAGLYPATTIEEP